MPLLKLFLHIKTDLNIDFSKAVHFLDNIHEFLASNHFGKILVFIYFIESLYNYRRTYLCILKLMLNNVDF